MERYDAPPHLGVSLNVGGEGGRKNPEALEVPASLLALRDTNNDIT